MSMPLFDALDLARLRAVATNGPCYVVRVSPVRYAAHPALSDCECPSCRERNVAPHVASVTPDGAALSLPEAGRAESLIIGLYGMRASLPSHNAAVTPVEEVYVNPSIQA